jgi:acyl transferase domain-containing protein/thioesterase domain-containing protein
MDHSTAGAGQLAIIGMAFRFPGGASSASTYWEFLNSGQSAIRETPPDRFDIDAYYSPDPNEPGTTYSRVAGYVDDPFRFDRKFFRTSAAQALEMDPQQRWMLELSWAALENAGLAPSKLRGKKVGLFMTTGEADYGRRTIWSGDPHGITTYSKLGNLRAMAPGRVAHVLGLSGPAIFVDTTCSSSLVAIHLAAQSLRTGDCDLAIAGGVNLILGPEETIGVARLQAMSPSGVCRPFDADADGYIRGEGGGAIVLKRFEDALEQRDRIDAVLAGSAINSDGASNGLTAPNGAAQEAVIRQAIARAGIHAEDVSYVEAHGTGTSLGDPIELAALRNVYARNIERQRPLLVGSVKAQVGHLEGAAGMAGIVKAILILRHRHVPGQVNFAKPNPRFRWEGVPLEIPRQPLPLGGDRPYVGISGFGITGTNVHMILAAHDDRPKATAPIERDRVLTLSARTPQAVRRLAVAYRDVLSSSATPLRDICYTASVRRDHFEQRLAVVGAQPQAFIEAIDDFLAANPSGKWHAGENARKKRLAFLFPGQGAWQPGIGAALYAGNSIFRNFADQCLRHLADDTAHAVLSAIEGKDASSVRHHPGQLAHFVVCFSLARTWMELGLMPELLIGHSLGEHVAAVIGGVMTLGDGLKAVEARGRLFDSQTPAGAMLAVAASVDELSARFEFGTRLFVAGINAPGQTVVSGTREAVAEVESAMVAAGKRVSLLKTYDTPGHSPMLASMREAFRGALQPLKLMPAQIPIVSTLTGKPATNRIADVEHWLDLVEQPVRFDEALHAALDGNTVFIEAGPGAALSKLARAAAADWQCAVSSIADGPEGDEEPELTGFAHACARLYSLGQSIEWHRLYGNAPLPAELPIYPFDDERFELPFPERKQAAVKGNATTVREAYADFDEAVGGTEDPPKQTSSSAAAGQQELLALLRPIAASVAPDVALLDDELPLIQQNMDSLALTELRVRLHKAFGSMPPVSMLARGASLVTLANYFASLGSRPSDATGTTPDDIARSRGVARTELDGHDLIVSLREGDGPVIALVHPVGGDVLCYRDLAAAWPGDPHIVAIRHPYQDLGQPPGYLSITQLASLYRSAVSKAVGRMPDWLGGWSFGGLIAHEMAAQWESDGVDTPALLIVDSPFYQGDFIKRLKAMVRTLDCDDPQRLVDTLLADPRFDAMLDHDFHFADLRRRVDAGTFAHIARLHAASAAALYLHEPRQVRTAMTYALATRDKRNLSVEQATLQLRDLTHGAITVTAFDEDHNSIVRAPSARRLAHFLSGESADAEHA